MDRRRLHGGMSARKSAPLSAGGVNARRIAAHQAAQAAQSAEPARPRAQCGNPFCRKILANRYARFCEDGAMCQRFRALQLQCRANAQRAEDEEDRQPLSHVLRRGKKPPEVFAIPRKKAESGRTLDLSAAARSPREQAAAKKHKLQEKEERKEKKRLKKANDEEEKRNKRKEAETKSAQAARGKKRRLVRHASAEDSARSASSSPVRATATAATTAATDKWTIPRAKTPARAKTAAQAIKNMSVDLVPLGVPTQANSIGGGRYVQNGNRSAAQSLRGSDPRQRPPSLTKFASPAAPPATAAPKLPAVPPPAVPPPSMPPRPAQVAQPTALPPLPPQPAPMPTRPVTPSSSPVRAQTAAITSTGTHASAPPRTAATGVPAVKRISTSDYLRKRKESHDRPSSRSSSLERSTSLMEERASPVARSSTRAPDYRRSDSAPLPTPSSSSSPDFRAREGRAAVDPHRRYPEAEQQFWRQKPYYDSDSSRMEYQDRSVGRSEFMANGGYSSGQRETHNYPPPRDRYLPRQQEANVFGGNIGHDDRSYNYAADSHFSPGSSPAEQPYWRENVREELPPPPPQRAPSPRRSEPERVKADQNMSGDNSLEEDTPTFSHHETFLPHLLSIFIHKLPKNLEAVHNVTKKPRKMNWYIKYVERIERLCEPYELRVKFEGLKAVVTVRGREWLKLQGNSTLTLYLDVIKSLRAEAMTWLRMYEEMEKAFAHFKGIYGSQANDSYTFLHAWNELKAPGNYISLPRQANYFCGARLHHWNFVVGKLEIGSGSHEEKREAFRLATISAFNFLLSLGRGGRRLSRASEVKRERMSEAVRGSRRSSSREPSPNRVLNSPANNQTDRASPAATATSTAGAALSSSAQPSPSAQPSHTVEPPPSTDHQSTVEPPATTTPQSSAEPSSSPVAVERTEKIAVAIIPATDSNSSHAGEQSDPGEEMSISDASDGAPTPPGSPRLPTHSVSDTHSTASGSARAPAASTTAAIALAPVPTASTSLETKAAAANASATLSVVAAPTTKPTTKGAAESVPGAGVLDSGSASNKDTQTLQTAAKAAVSRRRCMMCEMIRMRKPDGERCLRCQQNDARANGVLSTSLGL